MSDNPLLDAWKSIYGDALHGDHRWLELDIDRWRSAHELRTECIKKWSFAIPSDDALEAIAKRGPIVELGAGTGYWAKLLRERGVDVVAYDVMSTDWEKWFPDGLISDVLVGGVESVAQHADRALLLVWPYMDSMAYDAVRLYGQSGGTCVIYVGEGSSGCTADDSFFALMGHDPYYVDEEEDERVAAQWHEVDRVFIPQWDGIHDELVIYEPNGPAGGDYAST